MPVELPADGYACVLDPLDVLAHLAARCAPSGARTPSRSPPAQPVAAVGHRPEAVPPRGDSGSPRLQHRSRDSTGGSGGRRAPPVPHQLAADLAVFRAAAAEAGRAAGALPVVLRGDAVPDQDAGEGRPLFRGTVEQSALDARRVAELGVGHIVLQVAAPPEAALDAFADLRERLDR